jgi:trimeric autotransporter adhesin
MKNTTGTGNVASGSGALYSNTEGIENIATGINALFSNTTGRFNVAVGRYALSGNKTGEGNVVIGDRALYSDSTGGQNIAIGRQAGFNTLGSQNVFIGETAGYNETGSFKLCIATSISPTESPLIGGDFSAQQVGINRMPTTYTLEVGGTVWANGATISAGSTTWSDARYKENIFPIENALYAVMKMQGVRFDWKKSEFPGLKFPDGNQIGVIAQDVEKIFPQLVYTGPDGYKSVSYEKFTPVLIEAVKEQQKQIASDRSEIDDLKSQIQLLKERMNKMESDMANRGSR